MAAFRAGKIKVLTNCALFDEGLDIPGLDGVILARPTASLGRYLQMVGRALRPSPSKEYASIIDLAGNWERHGLPDDDRTWSLDGVESVKRGKSQKLQRSAAGEIEEVTIDIMPSNIQLQEINCSNLLQQLDPQWRTEFGRLVEIQTSKGLKPAWIGFRLLELKAPLAVWKVAAKQLGYNPGWAWHKWRECQEKTTA